MLCCQMGHTLEKAAITIKAIAVLMLRHGGIGIGNDDRKDF